MSSAGITLTVAGEFSSGIGMRVALTITGALSASTGVGDGDGVGSCATQKLRGTKNRLTNNNQQRGYFHITSFLQFLRGGLVSPKAEWSTTLILLFAKKFFHAVL